MEKRIFGIYTAEALLHMHKHPENDYKLQCDIDLSGTLWQPPCCLSSKLYGNGFKIKNAQVVTAADGCMGFWGCIDRDAGVWDLTLENISVTGFDGTVFLGSVAGINRGVIQNVTVTGSLTDSRCDDTPVGVIAGHNAGTITAVRSELTISEPEEKNIGLVGSNSEAAVTEGLWRDMRYSRPFSMQELAMRKTVVAHMHRMGTYPWKVPAELDFISAHCPQANQHFSPGEVYYGLPYVNKYGSWERFLHCLDENDMVRPWVMELGNGYDGFDCYMGTDCSGAIYWSWGRVCSGISFKVTADMVPLPENQSTYGVLPVGDYQCGLTENGTPDTLQDIVRNTPKTMLDCLAQLRMGDAIINWLPGKGGHAKLCVADPVVYRQADGSVSPTESYVITHELGGTGVDVTGGYSKWGLNRKNTFACLLEKGYLPITAPELKAGKRIPATVTAWVTAPAHGTIESNYRIISTTVTLLQNEQQAYTSRIFTATMKGSEATETMGPRTTVRQVDLGVHKALLTTVPAGEYTFQIDVLLSTGQTLTAHRGSCHIQK